MSQPRLIYDGDCEFCRYTVDYARSRTGDAVAYQPFQQVADTHPDISLAEFQASIQLLWVDRRYQGAEAAFVTLEFAGIRIWRWLYTWLPGFRWLTEGLYAWVAGHRAMCMGLSRWLIGPELRPARYGATATALIRAISLCSLFAFASLWWQIEALYGPDGILPAGAFLEAVALQYGPQRYLYLPSLLWIASSSVALNAVCATGTLAALLSLTGRLPATAAVVQYACYLSLLHVGQVFLSYQWDVFLLECLLVAAVLARSPAAGIWLARLLLLRFILLSGIVKLSSGDPTWWAGTALQYHFETQPLPNALAWYAHHLPSEFLTAASYGTLIIEIAVPALVLGTARMRLVPLFAFLALQLLIFLTGNYNFFNLLTMALCLGLLHDGYLPRPRRTPGGRHRTSRPINVAAVLVMTLGVMQIANQFELLSRSGQRVLAWVQPWAIANPYGLFAIMTTQRDELIIEGTLDGQTWKAYEFPFKPGAVDRRPGWATPHQPRLDWQMWFAALGGPEQADWIYGLVDALLRGSPAVRALLDDPFGGALPRAIRIIQYHYRFTTAREREQGGDWWVRDQRRTWLGPMRLRTPVITHQPLELR